MKYSIQLDLLISMPVKTVTDRLRKQSEVIFQDEKRREDGAFQTHGSLLLFNKNVAKTKFLQEMHSMVWVNSFK